MTTTKADRQQLRQIFDRFDVNKDGNISIGELAKALQLKHLPDARKLAKRIIAEIDEDRNTELDFEEFVKYMLRQEQKLREAFDAVDKNNDGTIEPHEVKAALEQLGVHVSLEEATALTMRLDNDNDGQIDWNEWRDYFNLVPVDSLSDIVVYWRQSLMIDIGEQMTVPPEFTKKEKNSGAWWKHLVAGGVAGAVSRLMTAPLDRLKILLQVGVGDGRKFGVVSGIRHMIKEGGMRSLWRGNFMNMLKIAPESACKFAAYEQMKMVVTSYTGNTEQITPLERFVAGSSAGAIAQSTIYPMEVLKTRLAVAKTGQYRGIVDCSIKTYKELGLRTFYKGYVPNILGILPYAGIDLSLYETLKVLYKNRFGDDKPPGVLVLLACGTTSSTCGQLATYPLALVRTKLQAQDKSGTTMNSVVRDIWQTKGLPGFYRGIVPNFMKVLPAVCISYVMYEKAKTMLGITS